MLAQCEHFLMWLLLTPPPSTYERRDFKILLPQVWGCLVEFTGLVRPIFIAEA